MGQSLSGLATATMLHLGRDPIADVEDTGNQEARMFRERYSPVRNALLRAYPWNFAMRFATLPGVQLAQPQFGFTHRCDLPAGGDVLPYCLRVWRLETKQQFQVQGRHLYLKSTPPCTIKYVALIDNEEAFDPTFYELLAVDMALALIGRIPASDTRKEVGPALRNARRELRRAAFLADAMESSGDTLATNDMGSWAGARRPL